MSQHSNEQIPLPAFRVWLCGPFQVERRVGTTYQTIRTAEWGGTHLPRLLMKALLCRSGRHARRDTLLELLWPELELEQAQQNLSTAASKLRNLLRPSREDESLLITEESVTATYHLPAQSVMWVDAEAAMELLQDAERVEWSSSEVLSRLKDAANLLTRGTFLEGEEGLWASGRRATIERARYRCCLHVATLYEQQGQLGQAEAQLSLLLEEDSADEDVLRRLMVLLHRQGLTHQALRLYEAEKDRRQWLSLLCRFYQLSTRIAQHKMDVQRALNVTKQAILVAIDLDDAELIASAFYSRARVYLEYCNTAPGENLRRKYFMCAKSDADVALSYIERLHSPLAGNIYLIAAEIYAYIAGNDASLRTQCEVWQEKVGHLIYQASGEEDGTFLKLDLTAFYHEKAKTLLRFAQIHEARRELDAAWKTLQPNLLTWRMNMLYTHADLLLAEGDMEGGAKMGIEAYTLATTIYSQKGRAETQRLLGELQKRDRNQPFVCEFDNLVRGA